MRVCILIFETFNFLQQISNTTMFLQGTDFSASSSNLFLNGSSTSLLHTAYSAYKNHNNLVFRPDDIWLAILTQFSHYVNKNSEELRHLFVSFSEGKKELWVNYTSITVDIVPFDDMIDQMVALVEENVNANLSSWILPNFSTTTKNDIVTSGSIFLATVQKYFAYNLWLSTCGIPNLTLLGRREDWVEIRMRIDKLRKFEISGETLMNKWASQLSLVLDEFVKVKTTGEVDHEFWEGIVQHGRYWAVCTARDFVDGWITAFTPFNKDGEWIGMHLSYRYKDYCEAKTSVNWSANAGEDGKCPKRDKKCRLHKINQEYNKKLDSPWNTIHIEDFLAVENRVKFPLKIKDDYAVDLKDGVYEGTVHAGYMGHAVDKDEVTLKPIMGWVVALHGKRPGYLNLMKKNKVI